jgi:iron complex outermembrane receptor protein
VQQTIPAVESRPRPSLPFVRLGGLAAVALGAQLCGEDGRASSELPAVTVLAPAREATPTAPDLAASRRQLEQVPGATSLVDAQTRQQGATGTLSGFLALAPGIFAEPNSGGQDTRLSIRGSGIQSEDGVAGVAVLQDGIPINEADGEVDIESLDLTGIHHAEIYRGADALRYGATNLGGALNFVSLTGHDVGPVAIRIEGGSFGYRQEHVASGLLSGPWDGIIGLTDRASDGFREHSRESSQRVAANLGYRFSSSIENRFYATYAHLDRQSPGDLAKDELADEPSDADPEAIEQDLGRTWDMVRLADKLALNDGPRSLEASVSWTHRLWRERGPFTAEERQGILRFSFDDVAGDLTFIDRSPWLARDNQLLVGMQPSAEIAHNRYYENLDGEQGDQIAGHRIEATNLVWFAEERNAFLPHWQAVLGAQLAIAHRAYHDDFAGSPNAGESDSQTRIGISPKLGVIYRVHDHAQLFANASRSFQPPSIDDLVLLQESGPVLYRYAPLRAQTATTVEVGTRGDQNGWSWDVALYRSWVRNELLELNDAFGNGLGTVNASPTIHQGVEIGLETELLDWGGDGRSAASRLLLEQSYTLNDCHFADDAVYGRNRLAGIPVHLYRAELTYRHRSGFYAGPGMTWSPSRYPVDHANTLYADPYVIVSARAGWMWGERFQVFVEGTNLTDRHYAASVAPIADARTDPDPEIFRPGNGRAVVGGIAASW